MKLKEFLLFLRYLSEPVLFFYAFGSMLQSPTLQQYLYHRFSEDEGFHYSYTQKSNECSNGNMNTSQKILQEKVQYLSARFIVINQLCTSIPSVVMTIFYGALSDVIGRRAIIILIMVTSLIDSLTTLFTMIFKLPVMLIYFGNVCAGVGGGMVAIFTLIVAYTADVTKQVDRAVRIGFIEACLFLGMMLSYFVSGPLISKEGFASAQIFVVCCQVAALGYSFIILKEPNGNVNRQMIEKRPAVYRIFHEQPFKVWKILVRDRPNRRLLYQAIAILVTGLTLIVGIHPTWTLYLLNSPFCFGALDIGNLMGVYYLVLCIGTIFGMKVLAKCLPEWLLSISGYILSVVSFVILAFAKNTGMIYGSVFIRMFGGLPSAIFRGNISRIIDEDEQGAVFSVVTSIDMLLIFLATLLFNFSYTTFNTMSHPGWVFLLPASLTLVPLLFALLYWRQFLRKDKTDSSDEMSREITPLIEREDYNEG